MNRESMSSISRRASTSAATTILLLVAPCFATPLQVPGGASQDAGSGEQFEQDADYGTSVVGGKDAGQEARNYLKSRNWQLGENGSAETGFTVFIGEGSIEALGPAKFDVQRRTAFKKAMLSAKEELVRAMALRVETSMRRKYEEGMPPSDSPKRPVEGASSAPGALEKLGAILEYEIDEELRKRNIDTSLQSPEERAAAETAAREAARVVLNRSSFKDAIRSAATYEASGLQAFRTFECVSPDGGGTVAVIAIHSRKTEALQRALLGLEPAPRGEPQASISAWVQGLDTTALLSSYGAQIRFDEKGELVLVAFGQASPMGKSREALQEAGTKADEVAVGVLRSFMGELVRSVRLTEDATSLVTFADDEMALADESRYQREIEAEGQALSMPGIETVHSWQSTHPKSDRPTKGVVKVWSVSNALAMNALRERIGAAGGAKGGRGMSAAPQPTAPPTSEGKPRTTGTGFEGQGVEGQTP